MSYLADTDSVIDALNPRTGAARFLAPLRRDGLAVSLMTYGEVMEGVYFGPSPYRHAADLRRWLRGVKLLPLDRSVIERFARVRGQLRAQGQLIPDPDLLIAATGLTYGLTLVTRNARHFQRVPGLSILAR